MLQVTHRPPFNWSCLVRKLHRRYPHCSRAPLALVVLSVQSLYLAYRMQLLAVFSVSTSRFGRGCLLHSLRTPTGAHSVVEKIGDGYPLLSRFCQRRCSGARATLNPHATIGRDDAVCTRIVRLAGLEQGHNQGGCVDSYKRCIYIHGTADEKRIGRPASIGCIRMRNQDVCTVYDRLRLGSLVYVIDS